MVFSDLAGPSIAPLYQASDLFVLPSKGEGFPLVIQEALDCGLPLVCRAETAGADAAVSAFLSAVPLDERNPDATALAFGEEIDRVLAATAKARFPVRSDSGSCHNAIADGHSDRLSRAHSFGRTRHEGHMNR
jgi:glycosyltransferase involved in cell wall biosynthesis